MIPENELEKQIEIIEQNIETGLEREIVKFEAETKQTEEEIRKDTRARYRIPKILGSAVKESVLTSKLFLMYGYKSIRHSYTVCNKNNYKTMYDLDNIILLDVDELKKQKIKTVIIDWEDTLAKPGSIDLDSEYETKFYELKNNFNLVLFTNRLSLRKPLEDKYKINVVFGPHIKPGPDGFKKALYIVNSNPKETVVIGDSWLCDIVGANNSKINAIHLKERLGKGTKYHNIGKFIDDICYNLFGKEYYFSK